MEKTCNNCLIGCVCKQAEETKRDCFYWSPAPRCENCRIRRICDPPEGTDWCPNHEPGRPKTTVIYKDKE